MTLNAVIALILRFFSTEFDRFSGRLYHSDWKTGECTLFKYTVVCVRKSAVWSVISQDQYKTSGVFSKKRKYLQ